MNPGRIPDASIDLVAPIAWRADAAQAGTLPVRIEVEAAGLVTLTSAWFPNPDELARLAAGAPVLLTIAGDRHPPVALAAGELAE